MFPALTEESYFFNPIMPSCFQRHPV